jgi:HK97 family phage portal protein
MSCFAVDREGRQMALLDKVRGLFGRKSYTVPSGGNGGWHSLIREPFAGAWQRNLELNPTLAATFYTDFSCRTLIANDIAKLGVKLMQRGDGDIWTEVENPSFSPVLREPNHYQTSPQFWESWILSKLGRGNTYVLKGRDNRRIVTDLYVLDPRRVQVLVANDGSVFYQLSSDELNGLPAQVTVPATEIIHDRMNTIFADCPLLGAPPIYAGALAAIQGLSIQSQGIRLFQNNAQPGGILTTTGHIEDDTVARLRAEWEKGFGGNNFGRLAVLGDGLKFEKMSLTAVEGQMLEQLKWASENICTTYHVPGWKVGVGERPAYNTAQQMNEDYYSNCIQTLVEHAEAVLDKGLGLGKQYGLRTEFDIDNLLRMDASAQAEVITTLVGKGIMTPNEGRARFNLKKIEGGDTVYMQEQDIPISVAASRTEHPSEAKARAAATASAATTAPKEQETPPAAKSALAAVTFEKSIGEPLQIAA